MDSIWNAFRFILYVLMQSLPHSDTVVIDELDISGGPVTLYGAENFLLSDNITLQNTAFFLCLR